MVSLQPLVADPLRSRYGRTSNRIRPASGLRCGSVRMMVRNNKRECGPRPIVVRRPHTPTMGFNNGAADGKAHAHAVAFRRVERFEQAVRGLCVDANPRIANAQPYAIVIISFGADYQFSWAIFDGTHRVGSVP